MALGQLGTVLSELYPNSADVRRLADGAGVPTRHLVLDGSALQMWYGLLEEAERRGKMLALISVVRDDYADYQPLLSAAWTYLEDQTHLGAEPERVVMNENTTGDVRDVLDTIKERLLRVELRIEYLEKSTTVSVGLDSKALLLALGVAGIMFVAIWVLSGGGG